MWKTKKGKIIIGVVIVFILGIVFAVTNSKNSSEQVAVDYLEATVTTGDITMSVSGSGNIEAKSRSEIKSETSGTVYDIFVEVGDKVSEGDLLFTVQSNTLNNATESDRLNYVSATNDLNNLYADLNELKIYSQNDGTISLTTETIGDSINSGQVFATVTDESNMQILAPFSPDLIGNIKIGDSAQVTLNNYYISLDGIVTKVGGTPKPYENGLMYYEVTIDFENPGALSSDDTAVVTINNLDGAYKSMFNRNLKINAGNTIRLDATAELNKLYVSNGDYVKAGQIIAEFTSENLEQQIASQQITVAQRKLSYEKSLGDSAVYSPVAGTVVSVLADEGDSINDNTTTVVVSNLDEFKAVIPIDETDINKLEIGQEAVVTFEGSSTNTFKGKVASLSLEGTEQSGTVVYDVTIAVTPNETGDRLLPNMNINATVNLDEASEVLLLPIEAVQNKGDKYFVMVNKTGELTDRYSPVEVGLISKEYVEISSGLSEDDVVYYPKSMGTGTITLDGKQPVMIPGAGGGGQRLKQ